MTHRRDRQIAEVLRSDEILKGLHSRFHFKVLRGSAEPTRSGAVAKDYYLARIRGYLETVSMNLGHEILYPGKPLDIAGFSPDDTGLLNGFGGNEILEPELG